MRPRYDPATIDRRACDAYVDRLEAARRARLTSERRKRVTHRWRRLHREAGCRQWRFHRPRVNAGARARARSTTGEDVERVDEQAWPRLGSFDEHRLQRVDQYPAQLDLLET